MLIVNRLGEEDQCVTSLFTLYDDYSDLSTHPQSLLDLDAAKRTRNNPSTGREHETNELFAAKVDGWLL